MKKRDYLLLWGMGLLILLGVAFFQHSPGYMDAEYYYTTALRIAKGDGLTEPFLWNYLGDTQGEGVVPSYGYWMPLASFLALGGGLRGGGGFPAARAGFLLVAATIPPLTAALAYSFTEKRKIALMAGALASFSSFYLPFLPTTDTFGLYMIFGGLFFLLLASEKPTLAPFGLGILAGLMHLSRADGFIWLGVAVLAASPSPRRRGARGEVILGYLLTFGPWMLRNQLVFGSPLGAGGLKTLWLTTYNELYTYPASQLTFARWWGRGLAAILQDRAWALGQNLQTALAVQGQILLAPLILLGGWKSRRDARVALGGLAWLGTLGLMTVIFPFAGARGGFFHSGAAFQPLLWALSALGLHELVSWGAKKRGWKLQQAWRVLGTGIVLLLAGISIFIVQSRVVGAHFSSPAWDASYHKAQKLEQTLQSLGAGAEDTVMVNNPPGYSLVSERPAIVIPNGDVNTLLAAAQEYHAKYLILEANHPQPLDELYDSPHSQGKLRYLQSQDGTHFFRIED